MMLKPQIAWPRLLLKGILLALLCPATCWGDLTLLGGTIPHVLHEEKPGPHNAIMSAILLETGPPTIRPTLLPYGRALRNFQAREADCLYATINNPVYFPPELTRKKLLLFSQPVNIIRLHAFTRTGERPVHSWADFLDRTIVGTKNQLRAVTQHFKPGTAIFLTVFDTPKAFELLSKHRTDIAMAYDMDAYLTVPNTIVPIGAPPRAYPTKYEFDPNFYPIEWGELLACWNSPEAIIFIKKFNAHIDAIRASGELEVLFKPYK